VAHIPETEAFEQHADAFAPLRHAVETSVQVEVLQRRQLAVDEWLVREIADTPAFNVDLELTACRCRETGAKAQQRRLAGAVRAGDEQEVVHADVEVEAAQDSLVAVTLLQRTRVDHSEASASTNAKNTTLMTPLTVKNAALRRRRSPGRTSECSYARSTATVATPSQ
jgi:hypothetical protein